jgi:hypothetical protein
MKYLSKLTVPVLAVACFGGIGMANLPEPLELGFADCHTLRAAKEEGQNQERVYSVVLRMVSKDGKRETFAISNNVGYVSVPLRPGNYCVEAYDRKGLPLELDSDQARCFEIKAKDSLYLGVVLAAK